MLTTVPVRRWRRFPVFFLLDTSVAMRGTLEVAMRQGLLQLKNELQQHSAARFHVYLSCMLFGETIPSTHLQALSVFTPYSWQAGGGCYLRPALNELTQALRWDVLTASPDHPGDYAPLLVLVLGDRPVDSWQDEATRLQTLLAALHVRVVTLITRRDVRNRVEWLKPTLLLLDPVRGEGISNFFEWTTSLILNHCNIFVSGAALSPAFPALPYGISGL